ncbi:MAG: helix-turn-helix transcriptional regulator [Henriciella sp.]|nr:helix-turn-helix transcriptional regulator [Henriciella sp.]
MKRDSRPYGRMRLFLAEWREYRALTQDQLSETTGIAKSTISRLENREMPVNERHIYKFADALRCEPIDLLTWNPLSDRPLLNLFQSIPDTKRREARRILQILAEPDQTPYEIEPAADTAAIEQDERHG